MKFSILMICMAFMAMLVSGNESKCEFEAMFVFGDANSDTGGFFSAFPSQPEPYGMTYFQGPTGRPSDGRLYVDFLAQALGFPFPSPYLQSIGPDFRHGANFATSGSTVLRPDSSVFVSGISPFYLGVQLNQMRQFKNRVDGHSGESTSLPSVDVFGKSLYVIYIGQTDFTSNLENVATGKDQPQLPQVISQISSTIKDLYGLGGRTFLVLNLAPVGCYPGLLAKLPQGNSDIDKSGCSISYNNAVNNYNNLLNQSLSQTRQEIGSNARLIYVNSHDVLLELFQHPTSHGMKYGTKACCGAGDDTYNYNPDVLCGENKWMNGKLVTAQACKDPQNYLSWDGMHLTETANRHIADAILSGSNSEPAFSFPQYCDVQPIG